MGTHRSRQRTTLEFFLHADVIVCRLNEFNVDHRMSSWSNSSQVMSHTDRPGYDDNSASAMSKYLQFGVEGCDTLRAHRSTQEHTKTKRRAKHASYRRAAHTRRMASPLDLVFNSRMCEDEGINGDTMTTASWMARDLQFVIIGSWTASGQMCNTRRCYVTGRDAWRTMSWLDHATDDTYVTLDFTSSRGS